MGRFASRGGPLAAPPSLARMVLAMATLLQAVQQAPRWVRTSIVVATLLTALSLMTAGKLIQYDRLQTNCFDHAIQTNVSWNVGHGNGFHSSILNLNYLGDHFSPIHALTALLLLAWPSPAALLVLQCVAVTLAGWGVYRLGRLIVRDWILAALLMGLFLANPYLQGASRFDYHPVMLATPCYVWLLVLLERRRWLGFFALAAFACLMKENVPLALAGMAVMMCLRPGWRLAGGLLLTGSAAIFLAETAWLMPLFLDHARATHLIRYSNLGETPGQVLRSLLNPLTVAKHTILVPEKLEALGKLLLSFGLVPLAGGWYLIPALFPIAWNMVSGFPYQYRFSAHYPATIAPFLIYAAAYGTKHLWRLGERKAGRQPAGVLLAGVLAGFIVFGIVKMDPYYRRVASPAAVAEFRRVAATIPPDASVAASSHLTAQLACRRDIRLFRRKLVERGLPGVAMIVLNVRGDYYGFRNDAEFRDGILLVLTNGDWQSIHFAHDILVLKRGEPTPMNAAAADYVRTLQAGASTRPGSN